jgi:hypothetical protein
MIEGVRGGDSKLEVAPSPEVYFSFANIVRYVTCGDQTYVVGIRNKSGRYQALGGAAKVLEGGDAVINRMLEANAADARKMDGEKADDVRLNVNLDKNTGASIDARIANIAEAFSNFTGQFIEPDITRELQEELEKKGVLTKQQCKGLNPGYVTTLSQWLPPSASGEAKDSKRKIRIFRQFDVKVNDELLQALHAKSTGENSPLVLIPLESSTLQQGINTVKEGDKGIVTVTLGDRDIQLADNIIPELVRNAESSPEAVENPLNKAH